MRMLNETDGQGLIERFFAALERRDFDQCRAVMEQMRLRASEQPHYEVWHTYFSGILANERDYDWAEAERIFQRLLQTDLDSSLRFRVLYALGRTYDYCGRWTDAITIFEQMLSIAGQHGHTIDQVKAWKHLAITYRRGFTRGEFPAQVLHTAVAYCERALNAIATIHDPGSATLWLKGSIWNTLGLMYRTLGRWDDATMCYHQDLAICRERGDRLGEALSYGNLGEIYQKRGKDTWPTALRTYHQALQIIRTFNDQYQELEVLANLGFLHEEMGDPSQALTYYGQAISLIETMRVGVTSESGRAGFLATMVETYARGVLLSISTGQLERAFNYVERARARAFLDMLDAGSEQVARKLAAAPISLAQVQAALPPDALLLEYFTTGLLEVPRQTGRGRDPQRHRFPPEKTLLFAITRDQIEVYDANLSPNALRPRHGRSVVELHFLLPEMRRKLYMWLIQPVAHLVDGMERVYLVPHGPLHCIPFQALLAPDGDTLLREHGPHLIYGPSATVLFRSRQAPQEPAQESCLAVAYNGTGADRLYFAEAEATSIARLMDGQSVVGPTPKKNLLYHHGRHYRFLHLSCHGTFDPEHPLASALHLSPDEDLTTLDILSHLRLRCDLVSLSACESGLSRVWRGDELVGFVRAFMAAGASSLVCTLWRVDEGSTRLLMEEFYQRVRAGVAFGPALQLAQLHLRNLSRAEAGDRLKQDQLEAFASLSRHSHALPIESSTSTTSTSDPGACPTDRDTPTIDELLSAMTEEYPFADPYYWAGFILIGDCRSRP